jgi:hypothetical protein
VSLLFHFWRSNFISSLSNEPTQRQYSCGRLPLELISIIINLGYNDSTLTSKDIASLNLTSHCILPISRKLLFRSIELRNRRHGPCGCMLLCDILQSNPLIGKLVECIEVGECGEHVGRTDNSSMSSDSDGEEIQLPETDDKIVHVLNHLTHVRSIKFSVGRDIDLTRLASDELVLAMRSLISLPTIKRLHFEGDIWTLPLELFARTWFSGEGRAEIPIEQLTLCRENDVSDTDFEMHISDEELEEERARIMEESSYYQPVAVTKLVLLEDSSYYYDGLLNPLTTPISLSGLTELNMVAYEYDPAIPENMLFPRLLRATKDTLKVLKLKFSPLDTVDCMSLLLTISQ